MPIIGSGREMRMMGKKRIAIFVYLTDIDNSTSIINLLQCLDKNKYIVDVFLYNKPHTQSLIDNDNISFFANRELFSSVDKEYFSQVSSLDFFLYIFMRSFQLLLKRRLKHFIYQCAFLSNRSTYCFSSFIFSKTQKNEYCCFIGIEKDGIILADLLNRRNTPQIYYSLELFYDGPASAKMEGLEKLKFFILKHLEESAHGNSLATIIQDQNRANVLLSYNKIRKDQDLIFMPVSMCGEAYREKTTALHDLLGIPKGKKIILQIGGITPDRFSLEIARASKDWPGEYILVMHGYFSERYKQEILEIHSDKLILSEKKLSYCDIPRIVASAYIGLVFYRIKDTNYYNNYFIGNSSGQLAHFLQCGIPIITNDVPDLQDLTSKNLCGESVTMPESIRESIFSVSSQYEFYRKNAFMCFEKKYKYIQYCKNFIEYLKSLENPI